jgi:hypothetical protein
MLACLLACCCRVLHHVRDMAALLHLDLMGSLACALDTVPSLRECLRQVYTGIYVEYVTKNPLQPRGTPITSNYFVQNLNKYIRGLPYFLST